MLFAVLGTSQVIPDQPNAMLRAWQTVVKISESDEKMTVRRSASHRGSVSTQGALKVRYSTTL